MNHASDNQHVPTQHLIAFRESLSISPAGDRTRQYLGLNWESRDYRNPKRPVPLTNRGNAPAFSTEEGRMVVRDWHTNALMPDFVGIAYDYMAASFVLLGWDNGERSISYLIASSFNIAQIEAEALKAEIQRAR